MAAKLKKNFFERSADVVARELLGKIMVRKIGKNILRAKIVETEAYFDDKDPASRAVQKGDLRKTMEMDAGTILVYGVHNNWLVNFVTGYRGDASAVLIRAVEPLNFSANGKGPGLLTRALFLAKEFHKKSLYGRDDFWVEGSSSGEKIDIIPSFRIGVKQDLPKKLRFYIKGNKHISRK